MLAASGVELPALQTTVIARGPGPAPAEAWAEFLAGATDEGRAEVDRRAAALGPDDPSDILFTSGTTGVPKGVVKTHGRTLGVATDWVAMTGLQAGDRYLMVNPYFHMFGLKAGILASVAAGATMLPRAGVRPRPGAGPGGRGAGHRAAGRAHALPVAARPSRAATTTTCPPCGWRSPAPPTSPSS